MNGNASAAHSYNIGDGSSPPTVVVTGASAGIGRAVVREYAAAGARIGMIARGRAGLEAGAEEVEKMGGTALVVPTDVSDYDAVDRAADTIEKEFGPIDIWVNGAFATIFAPFREITPEEHPGTDHGAHGIFDDEAHDHSPTWWLRSHARGLTAAAAASTAAILAGGAARARLRHM